MRGAVEFYNSYGYLEADRMLQLPVRDPSRPANNTDLWIGRYLVRIVVQHSIARVDISFEKTQRGSAATSGICSTQSTIPSITNDHSEMVTDLDYGPARWVNVALAHSSRLQQHGHIKYAIQRPLIAALTAQQVCGQWHSRWLPARSNELSCALSCCCSHWASIWCAHSLAATPCCWWSWQCCMLHSAVLLNSPTRSMVSRVPLTYSSWPLHRSLT